MDIIHAVGLFGAGLVAGAINSVAGGGSLVSFPVLVAAGFEAKAASVTNTVALWPGYASGTVGYRQEVRRQRTRITGLLLPTAAGAILGSAILLATSSSAFGVIAPFLILFACGLMLVQDRVGAIAQRYRFASNEQGAVGLSAVAGVFVLSAYGAYFGAGLGILMLAVLAILLPDDIQRSNALKTVLSAFINVIAVVYFALFGPVHWSAALVMAVGALSGGYFGVGIARRLGRELLRSAVVLYGILAATVMFWKL